MRKKVIHCPEAPAAVGPYSHAMQVGNLLFVSGQLPINPANNEIADDVAEQTRQVMRNLLAIVHRAGGSAQHIVKATIYLTDMNDFAVVNQEYAAFFEKDFPARATLGITALARGAKVEIEAIACLPA